MTHSGNRIVWNSLNKNELNEREWVSEWVEIDIDHFRSINLFSMNNFSH